MVCGHEWRWPFDREDRQCHVTSPTMAICSTCPQVVRSIWADLSSIFGALGGCIVGVAPKPTHWQYQPTPLPSSPRNCLANF